MKQPAIMRLADRALNPLIGKSIVVYAAKPTSAAAAAGGTAGRGQRAPAAGPAVPDEAHAAA